jgi:hypothetical protein
MCKPRKSSGIVNMSFHQPFEVSKMYTRKNPSGIVSFQKPFEISIMYTRKETSGIASFQKPFEVSQY